MGPAALPTLADFTVARVELMLLMLLRVGSAIFLFPVISSEEVPTQVKAGLSFVLCLLLFPVLPAGSIAVPDNVFGLFALALKEIYVGLVLGFSGTFVLAGLRIAGEWIDQESGFAMLQLFDPLSQEGSTALGSLLVWMFTALLLVSGGYLFFFQALAESFQAIPLAGAHWEREGMLVVFLRMSSDAFIFGLKASAPVLAALFLSSLGLAITSRIMPQANVWMAGMPLKLLLGSLTVIYALPAMWQAYQKHFDGWAQNVSGLLRLMGG